MNYRPEFEEYLKISEEIRDKTIQYSDITQELSNNFLVYASTVNEDRAIPDATSGLKPVARRILYNMYDNKFLSSKPHVKSARVVGDTMSRLHPHGDSSIYDAMVRLAQPWVMRYPLIDFHGNYGNIGGDGAAASRYTEVRLSKIAEEGMLEGIKKNIVDFQLNYSEDEQEPITLPSLFPNLLCNPNSGIGVSIASVFLPHNLIEVGNAILAYIKDNNITIDELVKNHLPAPDFPLGGKIINQKNMLSCYKTGKGRVIMQAKYQLETRNKKNLIVFNELPYGVNTETLLEQINEAYNAGKIIGMDEVRDESNKKGIRIVVELARDGNATSVINKLFKETDLQKNVSFNQVALVNKVPTTLNLKQVIKIYVKHQIDIIIREIKFDLAKAEARLEIVDGLLIALEDIDNVIKLIKESKSAADARIRLSQKYNLSENQSKAIVDMKLGRIAGLEKIEIQNEQKELIDKIKDLKSILTSEFKQTEILSNRLSDFIKKFGDARRTELADIEIKAEEKIIEAIEPEDVVIVLTKGGHIKRVPVKSFKIQKRNGKGIKNKDDSVLDIIKTNTIDTLIMFSTFGKIYRIVVDDVPVCANAAVVTAINTLIKLVPGEEIIAITSHYRKSPAKYVIFITRQGVVKKSSIEEYNKGGRSASGLIALKLKDGDGIADITFLNEEELILISEQGMSIRIKTSDIAPIGRLAVGVKAMKLAEDDNVVAALPINKQTDHLAIFTRSGIGKKVPLSEFTTQGRNGKGVICYKNEIVAGAAMVSDEDNILIIGRTSSISFSAKEIPVASRTAVGSNMIKNNNIVSIVKI